MTLYLLDTNIVSAMMREPNGSISTKIKSVGEENVCISIIVAAELRFGIARKQSRRIAAQFDAVLPSLQIVPFAEPADSIYADIRADLEKRVLPISGNDLLIAAHALSLDAVLVTANTREFMRITGLRVENWIVA